MRVTADNGRGVEVKDGGRGIPLLLVHGFPLSSEMFADMRPLVERVGRVVTLDLPGFGSSDAPESGYTMDETAPRLRRSVERLCDVWCVPESHMGPQALGSPGPGISNHRKQERRPEHHE